MPDITIFDRCQSRARFGVFVSVVIFCGGIFYREKGFWWNFGVDVGDFFDELEMIQVRPDFVERFDLEEERGRRVKSDELTYDELSSEELYPDD